jgi:hypothetical protein
MKWRLRPAAEGGGMAVQARTVAVVLLVFVAFAFALGLALTRSTESRDATVPGVTRDDYPPVGITTDETPLEDETKMPPSCRSASDGSIVARPFVTEKPPFPQEAPDSNPPPAPEPPSSERQDCPSV